LNWMWQTLAGLLGPTLFVVVSCQLARVVSHGGSTPEEVLAILYWLHLPLFMLHEFEEYVFPGGFREFYNTRTIFAATVPQVNVPLNEACVFGINIALWLWLIAGGLWAETMPWVSMGAILAQFVINGVSHPIVFQVRHRGYNPGLATTLALLIPYCAFVVWYVLRGEILSSTDWFLAALCACAGVAGLLILMVSRKVQPLVRHLHVGQKE